MPKKVDLEDLEAKAKQSMRRKQRIKEYITHLQNKIKELESENEMLSEALSEAWNKYRENKTKYRRAKIRADSSDAALRENENEFNEWVSKHKEAIAKSGEKDLRIGELEKEKKRLKGIIEDLREKNNKLEAMLETDKRAERYQKMVKAAKEGMIVVPKTGEGGE